MARFYLGFPLIHTLLVFIMYIPKRSFFRGSFTMFVTHLIYRLKNRKKVEPEYYEFMTVFSANEIRLRLRKMIERVLVIKIRST